MKILVWNIKFFSLNRIKGRSQTTTLATLDDAARALASMMYIALTVKKADADIFVVLEPRASAGKPGTLVDSGSGGPSGLINLLARLGDVQDGWFLVPPQRINSTRVDPIDPGSKYTECVGVFWRDGKVNFTGPFANTAVGIGPATEAHPAINYNAPWDKVVPANTTAAGRCVYFNQEGAIGFPEQTSRKPFCTTFTEVGGMKRTLELYSLHNETKAMSDRATDALMKLPFTPGTKKITLLAGDFNIDLSAPSTQQSTALTTVETKFGKLWPPQTGTILGKGAVYQPTTVKKGVEATPGAYFDSAALDFAFLNYTKDAEPPSPFTPSCKVVDRVKGDPNPPFSSDMINLLPSYASMADGGIDIFRGRYNYGHIGTPAKIEEATAPIADGTSDHLPILLEV